LQGVKRLLVAIVAALTVAAVGAGAGGVYVVRRSFSSTSGVVNLRGLNDPVEVVRDRWGIPHIYAKHAHDLFFAQGYVHAQDRLWQMELSRRTASGRLSELFGERTLQTDRFLRTIGLRRIAEATIHGLTAESREILEAYAQGVNAFINGPTGRLPIEFVLLRFRPEPWTPIDSLAYGKLMGWLLGGDWRSEILRQQLYARFGDEAFTRLMPDYPADAPIIVPSVIGTSVLERGLSPALRDPMASPPGIGSNNWVVGGSQTDTGGPLLANDPHLEAAMPSVWHIMHLSGAGYDVAGATFPGVPGVIVGHNRDVAWGVTNANPDVQDLFVIRFHPNDPTRYLDRGEWVPARMIREAITVKGRRSPFVEQVRWTRQGPVINTVVRGLERTLALRWTGQDSSTVFDAVDAVNRATTWGEFRNALRLWDTPSLNFVFAHRNGEIGYQMPGRVPIRERGSGGVPAPGWSREFDWKHQAVAFEQLPVRHARDGTIITANNRVAPAGYPHFLGREWDAGFRARRIAEMLDQGKASIDGFRRIQADVTSLPGRAVVAALKSIKIDDPALQPFANELLQWDGVLDAGSRPAAVYEALVSALLVELFKGPLDDAAFARYLRHRDAPMLSLLALLQEPDSGWWRGNRDEMVTTALREAIRDLTRRLGPSHDQWRWGRLHQPVFVHPLGRIKALAWIFNATPPEVGGDGFTINNGGFDPEEPFQQRIVASYRQILDVSNWDRSLVIHTTGQSGLPFHKHYRDFARLWARGDYVPLLFSRSAVDGAAAERLIMTP
jgi:penicillin amidase